MSGCIIQKIISATSNIDFDRQGGVDDIVASSLGRRNVPAHSARWHTALSAKAHRQVVLEISKDLNKGAYG